MIAMQERNPEGIRIVTHIKADVPKMVKILEPYLKGHKPRTENGIKKILKEEYNDKYRSKTKFIFY